jgi:thioredoxin 2
MRQIVCPGCGAANRTPEGRDPASAKCGRCGEKLFQGKPVDVTAAELDAHLRGNQGVAVLLDVWAPWCGPCRMMGPQFVAAAPQLEPAMRLLKLNSEEHPAAAGDLGVSGIPTLILFREGRVIARQSGAMSANQIVAWTIQALAQATA